MQLLGRLQRLRYSPAHLTPHDLRHATPSASILVITPFLAYDQAVTRTALILVAALALTGCADVATNVAINVAPYLVVPAVELAGAGLQAAGEPNGVANDVRWKSMACEGDGLHPDMLH
ncbi:MAG: hypothetical protein VYE18_05925 [Pseudomonadota bacterium]|nr:hypothetical protein [Pseudomonadota bacterium]